MTIKNFFEEQLNSTQKTENGDKEIDTSILKVIENTIVIKNTIYQIKNISSVSFIDLTIRKNKKAPASYWFGLLAAVGLIFARSAMGLFLLVFVIYLFAVHKDKTRPIKNYGLRIGMNSGERITLLSKHKDLVITIVKELLKIVNTGNDRYITFNLEDRRINIENSNDSIIISGDVSGDIVDNV